MPKKLRPEEKSYYQEDVEHRGKKYTLTAADKIGEDNIVTSHLDYLPHERPKGSKSRGNFKLGMCLPTCKCRYHGKTRS